MTLVQDVMTRDPETASPDASLVDLAMIMRDADSGFVPITDGDQITGVVTDRDIVVRALADGRNPSEVKAREISSNGQTATVAPDEDASAAAQRMRDENLRRLLVSDGSGLLGVVSIGDLAGELDPDSALADISEAPSNS